MIQRFFDILFSLIAIIFLLPVFITIIFILSLTGEREIFYIQNRVGLNGANFGVIKFATMIKNSSQIGTKTITVKNDPRILPFGKFLRKTKINELPQIINVLKGDMSLIGPRPLTKETFFAYESDKRLIIQSIKPGLSGVGSIIFRNEENLLINRQDSTNIYFDKIAPYKAELEAWYVRNRNIKNYFALILLTIISVFFSNHKLIWKILPTLPKPNKSLSNFIN